MFIALIGEDDYFKSKTCNFIAAIAVSKGAIKRQKWFFRSTEFRSHNNISNTYLVLVTGSQPSHLSQSMLCGGKENKVSTSSCI